jgi:peptidoglycan/xylan/chitin deacetylase (PgdA/CDA1 family)
MSRIPRLLLRAAVALVMVIAALLGLWRVSDLRGWQAFGTIVPRVQTDEKVVALTFDDGPTPAGADSILPLLDSLGVRATFFVNGNSLAERPDVARRFVAAGHELGNHTWSHPRMLLKSQAAIRRQVEPTDSVIRAVGHAGPIHFRPPYGKKLVGLPWYLHRTGRTTVTWDVEPESFPEVDGNAERIAAHVLERARPGSIILLHVMFPSRAESRRAVPVIVAGLRQRGYRFVTVSELMRLSEAGSAP